MNPLIHIGYHKTGTSWLQTHLFDNQGVGFASPFSGREIKAALISPTEACFDTQKACVFFADRLLAASCGGFSPVISQEGLSSFSYGRSIGGQGTAKRLCAVFPTAKILIVIREQQDMLLSHYKQSVKIGRVASPILMALQNGANGESVFALKRYDYHQLIGEYIQLFGAQNVLVLPYELFRAEQAEFLRLIIGFVGLYVPEETIDTLAFHQHVNPSLSETAVVLKYPINYVLRSRKRHMKRLNQQITQILHRLGALAPSALNERLRQHMQATIRAHVGAYYGVSNAQTVALTGLDLARYGYDLPNEGR